MKVTYLYDVEGWALHNVGVLLKSELRDHLDVELVRSDYYYSSPGYTETLYLAYVGLLLPHFPYRKYAHRIVCTVHDPIEVSVFSDRPNWLDYPIRPLPLAQLDALSCTSRELYQLLQCAYPYFPIFETPTFPHDASEIAALRTGRSDAEPIRLFSSTNAQRLMPRSVTMERLRRLGSYARSVDGSLSVRQISGLFTRYNRKNLDWLDQIASAFSSDEHVRVHFMHSGNARAPRRELLHTLARADVYICTSFMEGGPLPVMEAVLAGAAILTTPVGQTHRWVHHGINGFFCTSAADFIRRITEYRNARKLLRTHQNASLRLATGRSFDRASWLEFLARR